MPLPHKENQQFAITFPTPWHRPHWWHQSKGRCPHEGRFPQHHLFGCRYATAHPIFWSERVPTRYHRKCHQQTFACHLPQDSRAWVLGKSYQRQNNHSWFSIHPLRWANDGYKWHTSSFPWWNLARTKVPEPHQKPCVYSLCWWHSHYCPQRYPVASRPRRHCESSHHCHKSWFARIDTSDRLWDTCSKVHHCSSRPCSWCDSPCHNHRHKSSGRNNRRAWLCHTD